VIYLKFITSDNEHMCNYSYHTPNKSSYIIAYILYVISHPVGQKTACTECPIWE